MRQRVLKVKIKVWRGLCRVFFVTGCLCFLQLTTLLAGKGLEFKYGFEKGGIKCMVEYRITGELPIKITRVYEDGGREEIILDVPRREDAEEVHELVKASKGYLEKYMPYTVKEFAESTSKAGLSIDYMRHFQNVKFSLFVFYKGKKDKRARLVGGVGMQAYGKYERGSKDGVYWRGNPSCVEAKGVIRDAMKALVNFFVAQGKITRFSLVIDKGNAPSIRLAEWLGMRRVDVGADAYRTWGYDEDYDEIYVFTLSAKEWRRMHWGCLDA